MIHVFGFQINYSLKNVKTQNAATLYKYAQIIFQNIYMYPILPDFPKHLAHLPSQPLKPDKEIPYVFNSLKETSKTRVRALYSCSSVHKV